MAVSQGLRVFDATLISLTNVTSAGQFAGLTVIVAMATLWELILTQLIINSRYALMSLALSQRMGQRIGFLPRLVIAFFNTDEIFALAMAREVPLTVPFMLGLGTLPILGWTGGTLCGALAGSVLPPSFQAALGVMLYGMFIAVFIPPARKSKIVAALVVVSFALSWVFTKVEPLSHLSSGNRIIILTVAIAGVASVLFPYDGESEAGHA